MSDSRSQMSDVGYVNIIAIICKNFIATVQGTPSEKAFHSNQTSDILHQTFNIELL